MPIRPVSGYCRINRVASFQATVSHLYPLFKPIAAVLIWKTSTKVTLRGVQNWSHCLYHISQIGILNYGIAVGFGSVAHTFNCLNSPHIQLQCNSLMPDSEEKFSLCDYLCREVTPQPVKHSAFGQQTEEWTHSVFDWQVGLIYCAHL